MPCRYQILPEENLVARTFYGRVTTECILKLLDRIEEDHRFHGDLVAFDDLSRVEFFDVSSKDMSNFAALLSGFGHRGRQPARMVIFAPLGEGRTAALEFLRRVEGSETLHTSVAETIPEAATLLGFSDSSKLERILAIL